MIRRWFTGKYTGAKFQKKWLSFKRGSHEREVVLDQALIYFALYGVKVSQKNVIRKVVLGKGFIYLKA